MTKVSMDGIFEPDELEYLEDAFDMPSKDKDTSRMRFPDDPKIKVTYSILDKTRNWLADQGTGNFLDALAIAVEKKYLNNKVFVEAIEKAHVDLKIKRLEYAKKKYNNQGDDVGKMIEEAKRELLKKRKSK